MLDKQEERRQSKILFDSMSEQELSFFRKLYLSNRVIKLIVIPVLLIVVALLDYADSAKSAYKYLLHIGGML